MCKIDIDAIKIRHHNGLSKEHAFELIRAYTSINYSIMDGLPKRLRFWEQAKGT